MRKKHSENYPFCRFLHPSYFLYCLTKITKPPSWKLKTSQSTLICLVNYSVWPVFHSTIFNSFGSDKHYQDICSRLDDQQTLCVWPKSDQTSMSVWCSPGYTAPVPLLLSAMIYPETVWSYCSDGTGHTALWHKAVPALLRQYQPCYGTIAQIFAVPENLKRCRKHPGTWIYSFYGKNKYSVNPDNRKSDDYNQIT